MKRTIIITGGTTGIGKATAYQFAKNGWNVVTTFRIIIMPWPMPKPVPL